VTRINDYIWYLPHTPEEGDPRDVADLQDVFNAPIVEYLTARMETLGYQLKSNDVLVKLDDRFDNTLDTYYANVRYIYYLMPDVITRVHFQHADWAHFIPEAHVHRYYINLDRFKVTDPATQIAVPGWEGRLHTRVSNLPGTVLHHSGEDQVWVYASLEELQSQLDLFWQKFDPYGSGWLADMGGVG
jgi:hypothetical protein